MEIKVVNVNSSFIISSIEELMIEHFNEVNATEKIENLIIDWEKYIFLQQKGLLIPIGVFKDDKMIGYSCMHITESLHYKNKIVALSDAIFIKKDFRKSSVGLRLIKETEKICFSVGVKEIHWYVKPNSALQKIFDLKKYTIRDIVYIKQGEV